MSTIIRTKKDRNNPYVMINKKALTNKKMSAKAKGIFAYLMSLPDDWKLYISELKKNFKDGRDGISVGIKELEEFGYIEKHRCKNKQGRFDGWNYTIHEIPITDKPYSDKPKSEKPKLLSNDSILSNDNTNNNGDKSPSPFIYIRTLYFQLYKNRFNIDPMFDGVEGNAIKNILKKTTLEEFEKHLIAYMHTKDDFILKQGLTLKYFQTAIKSIRLGRQEPQSFNNKIENLKNNQEKYKNGEF